MKEIRMSMYEYNQDLYDHHDNGFLEAINHFILLVKTCCDAQDMSSLAEFYDENKKDLRWAPFWDEDRTRWFVKFCEEGIGCSEGSAVSPVEEVEEVNMPLERYGKHMHEAHLKGIAVGINSVVKKIRYSFVNEDIDHLTRFFKDHQKEMNRANNWMKADVRWLISVFESLIKSSQETRVCAISYSGNETP